MALRALLDVNVLLALHDPHHVHHGLAADWLDANAAPGWATCPITQNGCLRILSQPDYPNPRPIHLLLDALGQSFTSPQHQFWPDDISVMDGQRFRRDRVQGHRQLTDVYLLALAVRQQGRLVTLDARIAMSVVVGAEARHLVTLLH